MPSHFAHTFDDILQLVKADKDTLEEYPCEIYYSALVWLPKSVCGPLDRARNRGSIPTVEHGLPKTWPRQGSQAVHQHKLVADSLFTSPNSYLAYWLSRSDDDEIIAHQWDTKTDLETRYNMGTLPNKHAILKVADNGVFCFNLKDSYLSFQPLPHSPATVSEVEPDISRSRFWKSDGLLRSDQRVGVATSAHGRYAAMWNQDQFRALLVDVLWRTSYWLPLEKPPNFSSRSEFSLCFSPDETCLVVCFSNPR